MDDSSRCQSCGLLIHVGNFGINASGSMNLEYCNLCFQKGGFTDPDITLESQIRMTASKLIQSGTGQKEAFEEANRIIPSLKRWRNYL